MKLFVLRRYGRIKFRYWFRAGLYLLWGTENGNLLITCIYKFTVMKVNVKIWRIHTCCYSNYYLFIFMIVLRAMIGY